MIELYILRHGQAFAQADSDELRELTPQGQEDVLRVVQQNLHGKFDSVWVSPYVRAQQTANIAAHVLQCESVLHTTELLIPDASCSTLVNVLGEKIVAEQRVLLVSHQPLVGDLISLLLYGHAQQPIPMPTAGLAAIFFDSTIAHGAGELQWIES